MTKKLSETRNFVKDISKETTESYESDQGLSTEMNVLYEQTLLIAARVEVRIFRMGNHLKNLDKASSMLKGLIDIEHKTSAAISGVGELEKDIGGISLED